MTLHAVDLESSPSHKRPRRPLRASVPSWRRPLPASVPSWRRLLSAVGVLQCIWLIVRSQRTEFGLVQQITCKFALWEDLHIAIAQPLRLPQTSGPSPELQRRIRDVDADACVPRTLDASTIAYAHHHPFYDQLRRAQRTSLPPPPIFNHSHAMLCNEFRGPYSEWDYCLPITGRKDDLHCHTTDRMDLLTLRQGHQPCFGSALHMLLIDVYDQITRVGGRPAVLFGTLLGAVRNGTTIPFTEDADVGYVCHATFSLATLREALRTLGYHMFYQGVWRVCVAPTHPLASVLYDANMTTTRKHKVPYVDLYAMSPEGNDRWFVEKMEKNRRIPRDKFEPYSQVTLNNMTFDTVADPIDFLIHEYGENYTIPTPRIEKQ